MFDSTGILLLVGFIVFVIAVAYTALWAIDDMNADPAWACVICCIIAVVLGWSFFSSHPTNHRNGVNARMDLTSEGIDYVTFSTQQHTIKVWAGKCRPTFSLHADKSGHWWPMLEVENPPAANQEPKPGKSKVTRRFLDQIAATPQCKFVQG